MTAPANNDAALRAQVIEVLSLLETHLVGYGGAMSRDEKRSVLMAIHRLERGMEGLTGTNPGRTLADWITA